LIYKKLKYFLKKTNNISMLTSFPCFR